MSVYRFMRAEEANHAFRLMSRVLRVSRSAYYAWRRAPERAADVADRRLMVHIRATYRRHKGRYGAPRVRAEFVGQGFKVNRKRVARLIRQHRLVGRLRRVLRGTTTDSEHREPLAPNFMARKFQREAPNEGVVGDITYLRIASGWVYLAVLIDLYSRRVVGWAMDGNMKTSLCLRALHRMLATRGDMTGTLHPTDRGSHMLPKPINPRSPPQGYARV